MIVIVIPVGALLAIVGWLVLLPFVRHSERKAKERERQVHQRLGADERFRGDASDW